MSTTLWRNIHSVLKALKKGDVRLIEGSISSEGIIYPLIEELGVPREEVGLIISELAKRGILKPETQTTIVICPVCGSHMLTLHAKCPRCNSPKIKKGIMIEHLWCGNIDFMDKFKRGDELICAKCGRNLKAIGVDYRNLGVLLRCEDCGEVFPRPQITYKCSEGHSFSEDEGLLYEVKSYRIDSSKIGDVVDVASLVEDAVSEMGWRVESPAFIKGKSGVTHEFSLALFPSQSSDENRPELVIDVYISDELIDIRQFLIFYAKVIDVSPREKALIAVPGLKEEARLMAEKSSVHVLELNGTHELSERVADLVLGIIENILAKKRDVMSLS
ncbi:MAG: hypothetical protein DRJ41_04885 [Thermoprotei archaeon]|nr:MAG: hypothetical protein DRJ41_04885 [Thermoprotei archaeon]